MGKYALNNIEKDIQGNMFQVTINNPLEKGYTHEKICSIINNNFKTCKYFCFADEKSSDYHTHIFIYCSSRVRLSMIKKYFSKAHIEKCRGTVSENIDYIKKSGKWVESDDKYLTRIEGSFEEYGSIPDIDKGKKADLVELYSMIRSGMKDNQIIESNPNYITYIDKFPKIRWIVLSDQYSNKVRENLEVIYISGATGTGKTRDVLESNGMSEVYRVTDYDHPFDSYECQQVICFDEFRSSITLGKMLVYCDKYPVDLPSRYCNKFACYTKVYIISNLPLECQYGAIQCKDNESWKAFLRRICKVITYEKDGTVTEYNSVDEYFNRNL